MDDVAGKDLLLSRENVFFKKDQFDMIFEAGQEKVDAAIQSITTAVNLALQELGYTVNGDFKEQFSDGIFIIMLIGTMGKFFIPLYNFHVEIKKESDKVRI